MLDFTTIRAVDPDVCAAMEQELQRQREHLELIASENFVSPAVLAAVGSHLTNKYAEGYPGRRYYGGCKYVGVVENLAIDRAKQLFGAEHANVQPHSGAQTNMAVYFAMLRPGDTILGMNLDHGGHLTHGSPHNMSGSYYRVVPYGVSAQTETIDYDALGELAIKEKPKMIVAGASAYSRTLDFKRFRDIADACGALLLVDMAHIAGLVAGGQHPSPVPYADFVTTTTHKTLRGPRGGMILCKEQYAKAIDKAVFPGIQGGPLMHVIAGKAVCLKEAMTDEFKHYQRQIAVNAATLAQALKERGIELVSGGTDNHLMLVRLTGRSTTGKDFTNLLGSANITANKNAIPFDPLPPAQTSGVRLGTPAVTTRGMKEGEMIQIAQWIAQLLEEGESAVGQVRDGVRAMCAQFPLYDGLER